MNEHFVDLRADLIRGVLYGQAVGDALGLCTEFMSVDEVLAHYPDGIDDCRDMIQDAHRRRWRPGDWTDDTEQMLCVLDSLLEKGVVDIHDIALRLYRWVKTGGKGVGFTVHGVTSQDDFLRDPHGASARVWERTERIAAANGGVMRTSVLGIWNSRSPDAVRQNAEAVCRITHYDPRCVGSCVAVCLAICRMLNGSTDVDTIVTQCLEEAVAYDNRVAETRNVVLSGQLEALSLASENHMGYTLKTLGAAFWALLHANSFEEGVKAIVMQGGDADTNAAVTGSLLGARFGMKGIPEKWIKGLNDRRELGERISQLLLHPAAGDPV